MESVLQVSVSRSNTFATLEAPGETRSSPIAGTRDPETLAAPSFERPPNGIRGRLRSAATRAFDVTVSSAALVALVPLFLLIAIAIRVSSPGPILYQQTRVGRNLRDGDRRYDSGARGIQDRRRDHRRYRGAHGRPFQILKFRTMIVNAEEYGPQWSRHDDPRITPVGRILRKTRLDETPQFFNVLRGDMSILGPRPERPYFVKQFAESIPHYSERLRVRPGITGLAQVTLDYDASIEDVKKKLEHDLQHVRRKSWRRDLAILVRTIFVVFTGKGSC